MVAQWEPGTQYNLGDVVVYEGAQYKIIQPHRSQSDWTPPVTPALWGRLPESAWVGDQQQQQQPPPTYNQGGDQKPWNEQSSQQVHIDHEERKKNWFDLDDDRKKQLEIGGGLLGGLAALGAGYFAYKEHEKSEEEKKAQVWAFQNWLHDAQARTEEYHRNGPRGPATWILNHGRNIPQNAIAGGEEHGEPLYIARAYYEGGIMVGKASARLKKGAAIGFKHDEIDVETFEILIGDMRGLRWVDTSGHLDVQSLGATPVEGGRESDGSPIYIAQAPHHGGIHPGKASAVLDGAYIPYDGTEKKVKEYRVLCYA
ncbi:hypothetical protein GLOTRDRAFT_58343 [Gloeophyllum trabeum ATCC 11539]|uniref:Chitin-binding type-3 domain-containing protein n=1 Tax=Gloeophyllum trabeum (strain ATCC 11539 / FP-39264 / Madison 617) TaxID=670483 RepID=S7QCT7_GLOTA|nr:uncharacterized protein GLOTRDRAFT_58343 [Gloeophyllum trabeum ATCC 11539]EPQ57167.1 hypothetical protein GLOTRDRAFT_58343 [Gloeophyllum trabeum ATCC 11539]